MPVNHPPRPSEPEKHALTIPELRALLIELLTGAAGGTEERWLALIGEIKMLPIVYNSRSNWSVDATGRIAERNAIAKAVEVVRDAHPYVRRE